EACRFNFSAVKGYLGDGNNGVIDSVERQHRTAQTTRRCVMAKQIDPRKRLSVIAPHFVVEFVIAEAVGGVCAGVNGIAVVERIAAGTALHVADNKREVGDIRGYLRIRV